MKKNIVILSVFIFTSLFCIKAQENLELTDRHELKLNLGSSVFVAFPEVSYEYILSEDMSVGAAVGFGFDTSTGDDYNFKTTPFLRWFFGRNTQQPATGFFLEANAAFGTQNFNRYDTTIENDYDWVADSMFTTGLGLAVGWKYLSKNNWTGELYAGMGRNFIFDKSYDDVSLYSRVGISIGKRF
ncbi:MAG: DUF3575 domain-containing protein [Dysgonamonadaceae bacterium]|nr:DUF3575 domain-containing protein [Dysgonamonadaceae bacterium]MDD4728050.1 DUF3575 domain-containing protein [Dysgonamonadaceae bacterium]